MGKRDDLLAGARGCGKVEVYPGDRARHFDALQLLQLLDAALHLGGFGVLGAEALDEAHLVLYLALLPLGGCLEDVQVSLSRYDITIVVAVVEDELHLVQCEHGVDHAVEECPVM